MQLRSCFGFFKTDKSEEELKPLKSNATPENTRALDPQLETIRLSLIEIGVINPETKSTHTPPRPK